MELADWGLMLLYSVFCLEASTLFNSGLCPQLSPLPLAAPPCRLTSGALRKTRTGLWRPQQFFVLFRSAWFLP